MSGISYGTNQEETKHEDIIPGSLDHHGNFGSFYRKQSSSLFASGFKTCKIGSMYSQNSRLNLTSSQTSQKGVWLIK